MNAIAVELGALKHQRVGVPTKHGKETGVAKVGGLSPVGVTGILQGIGQTTGIHDAATGATCSRRS